MSMKKKYSYLTDRATLKLHKSEVSLDHRNSPTPFVLNIIFSLSFCYIHQGKTNTHAITAEKVYQRKKTNQNQTKHHHQQKANQPTHPPFPFSLGKCSYFDPLIPSCGGFTMASFQVPTKLLSKRGGENEKSCGLKRRQGKSLSNYSNRQSRLNLGKIGLIYSQLKKIE